MKGFLCPECHATGSSHIVEREDVFPVRDDVVTVRVRIRVCDACQSEVYDRELDSAIRRTVYDAYRARNNVIGPEEVRSIRERYGLSPHNLACLLSWDEATLLRYEAGSLAEEGHNQLLQLIRDPWNMQALVKDRGGRLSPSVRRRLEGRLAGLISEGTPQKIRDLLAIARAIRT